MNTGGTDGRVRAGRWSLLAAGMALVATWTAAFEAPQRLVRMADLRSRTAHAETLHASALDQRNALARLRDEQSRLEAQLLAIAGARESVGPAGVLDHIEHAASLAGISLLELRPLEGERDGLHARLPIQLRLAGTFAGTRDFLRTIESGAAAMPVRELRIRASDTASADVEVDVVLDVVLFDRLATDGGALR